MEQPLQVINLDIRGMTCAGCAISVEKALVNVNGVGSAEVNFALNRASVHFNPEFVNSSQLLSAIEDAGFSARRLKGNDDFAEALRLLYDGGVSGSGWVDVRPLSDGAKAFQDIHNGTAPPKIILDISS